METRLFNGVFYRHTASKIEADEAVVWNLTHRDDRVRLVRKMFGFGYDVFVRA